MSFESLNKDELAQVADFFEKDIIAADDSKGPSKKELIASLASGDNPVSWDDYKEDFLNRDATRPESEDEPEPEVAEEVVIEDDAPVDDEPAEADTDEVLIRYGRKNPTYEARGHKFTKDHPYKSIPKEDAEYLIKNVPGFRRAEPDEITDYYG